MAMIKCPECGNEISDKAFSCPKCGNPVSSNEYQTSNQTSNIKRRNRAKREREILANDKSGCGGCLFPSFIILGSIITILYFLVYSSSDSSNSSNLEPPAYCVPVTVNQMRDDLGENAVKAQSTYKNNWFEISGLLGTMDSDGYYFYLDAGPALFTFFSIKCKIPREKRSMIVNKLKEKQKGQSISVKGKVTDMGESMGYEVTIVDIY